MCNGIWACVPVKRFADAKQRLAPVLDEPERRRLAQGMLHDVLDALQRASGLAGIALLTVEPIARRIAAERGLRVIDDDAGESHTRAANSAIARLRGEGATAVVLLPGDVPLLDPREVQALLETASPSAFTIVPSRDRDGSNAILCAPPGVVPLRYGPGSFVDHLAAARSRGIAARVLELPGIALDIDHPEDLDVLMSSPVSTRAGSLLREFALGRKPPETIEWKSESSASAAWAATSRAG